MKQLSRNQKEFYSEAVELFRRNTSWLDFEEFAFGSRSPLYESSDSHVDVLKDPLYLALEDMWLELGVQQGAAKRRKRDEGRSERGRGRPKKQLTARKPITWRLPVDLLVRIAIRAEHEGIPVTTSVERELTRLFGEHRRSSDRQRACTPRQRMATHNEPQSYGSQDDWTSGKTEQSVNNAQKYAPTTGADMPDFYE